jgi:hypothetical protein
MRERTSAGCMAPHSEQTMKSDGGACAKSALSYLRYLAVRSL